MQRIVRQIGPRYDELTLFTMSYVCFLTILFSRDMWAVVGFLSKDPFGLTLICGVLLISVPGVVLSTLNCFSRRSKGYFEKVLLMLFATTVNLTCAVATTYYSLQTSESWQLVFPCINAFNAVLLIYYYGFADEYEDIPDTDTSLLEIGVGFVVSSCVFVMSKFIFELNWALTFGLCVAYVFNFNFVVTRYLLSPYSRFVEENFPDLTTETKTNEEQNSSIRGTTFEPVKTVSAEEMFTNDDYRFALMSLAKIVIGFSAIYLFFKVTLLLSKIF